MVNGSSNLSKGCIEGTEGHLGGVTLRGMLSSMERKRRATRDKQSLQPHFYSSHLWDLSLFDGGSFDSFHLL